MTRTTARRFLGGALGIGLGALGLQLLPLRIKTPEVSPAASSVTAPAVDPSAQAEALLTFEAIARTDPFDARRQPPAIRYVPPALRNAQTPSQPPTPPAPRLPLYGVATGPTGAVALIDANPEIPGAEIYRPGDAVGPYRLESISDTMVVLRGPAGVRTLRIQPPGGPATP